VFISETLIYGLKKPVILQADPLPAGPSGIGTESTCLEPLINSAQGIAACEQFGSWLTTADGTHHCTPGYRLGIR